MRSTHRCPWVRTRRRAVAALVVSAAVHLALLLCLRFGSPPQPTGSAPGVEVTVDLRYDDIQDKRLDRRAERNQGDVPQVTRAAPPARRRPSLLPALTPGKTAADEHPVQEIPAGDEAEAGKLAMRPAGSTEAGSSAPSSQPPARPPDLASAMGRVVASGEAESSDDGSPKARVARWTRDAVGEANVRAGDVPPIWHDVEMRIQACFHPPRKAVSDAAMATVLGKQLLNTEAARARTDGTLGPVAPPTREASLAADIAAGQDAARRPVTWVRAEISVEVGPDGLLRRTEITSSSGKAPFDKLAIEAVCAAIAEQPIVGGCRRAPSCTTRTRWAVEAALRVEPPPLMVPSDLRTGGPGSRVTPLALRFSFDETKGTVRHHRAFETEVNTRVKLLSID